MSSYKGSSYSQWRGGVGSYSSASSTSSLGSSSGVGSSSSKFSSSLGLKSMEATRSPSRESSYSSSLSSGSSIRPTTPTNRYSSISSRMKDTSSTGISSYSAGKSNSSYSKEKPTVSSYGIGSGGVSSLTSRFGSTLGSSSTSSNATGTNDSSSSSNTSSFRPSGTSGYIRSARESSFTKASPTTNTSTGYNDEASNSNNSSKRYSGSNLTGPTSAPKDGLIGDVNSNSTSNSTGNTTTSNTGGTSPSITSGSSSGLSSYKPYTTRSLLSSDIKPITAPATPASSLRTTARYGLKSGPSHAHYSVSLPTASTLKAAAMLTEEAKKQLSKSQYQKEKEDTKQLREIEEMTSWLNRGTCTILDSLNDGDDDDELDDNEDGEKMKANEISNEEEPNFTPRIFSPRYDGVLKHKAVQTDEEPKSKYAGLTAIPRPPLTMNFNSPFTAVMNRFNAEKTAKAAAANENSPTTPVNNPGSLLSRRGSLKKTTDSTSSNLTKDAKISSSSNSSNDNKGISNANTTMTTSNSSSSDQLSRSSLPNNSRQTSPASRRNSFNKSRTADGEEVVTNRNSKTGSSTMTTEQAATTSSVTKKLTTKASSPPAATATLNAGGLVVNLANKEFVRKSVLNVGGATKDDQRGEYGRKQEVEAVGRIATMQQKSSSVGEAANNDDNEPSTNASNNTRSSPLSTGLKRDSTRRPPTDPNKSSSTSVTNPLNRSISRMSSQYNLANNANNSSANSSRASSPSSHAGSATGNCNSSPAAGAPGLSRIKSTKNVNNPLRKLSLSLENSNASDSDSSLSVTSSSAAANSRGVLGSGISKLKKKLGTTTSDSDNNNNNTPAVTATSGAIDKRSSPLRRGSTTGGGGGGGTTCSSTASSRSASVERSNSVSNSTNAPIPPVAPTALHPSSLKKSLSKSDTSRATSLRGSPGVSSSSDSEKKKKGPVTIKISQEMESSEAKNESQDAETSYFGGNQQSGEGEPPKQTPFFMRMMNETPWVRKCQSGEIPWWMASNPDVPGTLGRNPSKSVIKVPTTKDIQEEMAAGGGMFLSSKQHDESSSSSELSDMECDDDGLDNKMSGPLGERTSPDGTEIPSVSLPDNDNSIVKGDGKQLFIGSHRNIDDILGFLPANLLAPSPSPAPNTPTPSATNAALQEAMDELVEAQRKLSLVSRNVDDHDKSDDEDEEESESESSSSSELSDDEEDNLHKSASLKPRADDSSSDDDEDSTGTSSSFAEVDPINMTIAIPPKEPSEPITSITQKAAALIPSSKSEKSVHPEDEFPGEDDEEYECEFIPYTAAEAEDELDCEECEIYNLDPTCLSGEDETEDISCNETTVPITTHHPHTKSKSLQISQNNFKIATPVPIPKPSIQWGEVRNQPQKSVEPQNKQSKKEQNLGEPNREESCCGNFCDMYCYQDPYVFQVDPCLADRPPWTNYTSGSAGGDRCHCHSSMFKERLARYLGTAGSTGSSKGSKFQPTQIIVDERNYLISSAKPLPQKRPLWGIPSTQWEIDAVTGKRGYKEPNIDHPKTPLPTFFKPLSMHLEETCLIDDAEKKKRIPILSCVTPYCRRKFLRAINRQYRGKRPKGTPHRDTPLPEEDPLIKRLMQEMQVVFNEFLGRKVPIIWMYGRPIKSVAGTRRNYCMSLAETHGFTYLSLDEEIAMLAARGSRAIQADNPLFEGFTAIERLALPVCIKLATDKTYELNRTEALEMLKYLMLKYFPTKGYIIDGFPWDSIDNEDFEKAFYPVACGLYFLDSYWTSDKSVYPGVIPPLYFRRNITYNENDVEEACGKFGLKTLKIIGAESLLDDQEKIFALHAVVDEYLDAYDEVLEGNEEVLMDDSLEYQTFGETMGYGLDLADYIPKKPEPGEGDRDQGQQPEPESGEPRKHFLELDKLKEMGWDGTKGGMDEYSPSWFDLGRLKVTPSQKLKSSTDKDGEEGEDEYDESGKKKKKKKGHRHKHDDGDDSVDEPCPEGEVCPEKKKKSKRSKGRRKHRCRCRCKCHRRGRGRTRHRDSDDDDDREYDKNRNRDPSRPKRAGRRRRRNDDEGSEDSDDGYRGGGDETTDKDRGRPKYRGKSKGKSRKHTPDSESQLDEDMEADRPLVYDNKWGFKVGRTPDVYLPRLNNTTGKLRFDEVGA